MRVFVTGGSGFVGSALIEQLVRESDTEVMALSRRPMQRDGVQTIVGDMTDVSAWADTLNGADVVVHCAALAHVPAGRSAGVHRAIRAINVEAVLDFARQAARMKVRRFVHVSTIKVLGDSSPFDRPPTEEDAPSPADIYGQSKMEAEAGLQKIAAETGLEVVIVRPPLVYGINPKANMRSLAQLVATGAPLPFGAVRNRRSFVSTWNLVSALVTVMRHSGATGRTYHVSDQNDLSTTELVTLIAEAMGRPVRLLPVPPRLLLALGQIIGRQDDMGSLVNSLAVDSSRISRELNWTPAMSVTEGMARMIAGTPALAARMKR